MRASGGRISIRKVHECKKVRSTGGVALDYFHLVCSSILGLKCNDFTQAIVRNYMSKHLFQSYIS